MRPTSIHHESMQVGDVRGIDPPYPLVFIGEGERSDEVSAEAAHEHRAVRDLFAQSRDTEGAGLPLRHAANGEPRRESFAHREECFRVVRNRLLDFHVMDRKQFRRHLRSRRQTRRSALHVSSIAQTLLSTRPSGKATARTA